MVKLFELLSRSSFLKLAITTSFVLLTYPGISTLTAQDVIVSTTSPKSDLDESIDQVLQGHSIHGEAFNEGPRQKAYLMGNCGNVHFPVTTSSKLAQAFIDQGVGQLMGFGTWKPNGHFGKRLPLTRNVPWLTGEPPLQRTTK